MDSFFSADGFWAMAFPNQQSSVSAQRWSMMLPAAQFVPVAAMLCQLDLLSRILIA
jgi:hypothetical protein